MDFDAIYAEIDVYYVKRPALCGEVGVYRVKVVALYAYFGVYSAEFDLLYAEFCVQYVDVSPPNASISAQGPNFPLTNVPETLPEMNPDPAHGAHGASASSLAGTQPEFQFPVRFCAALGNPIRVWMVRRLLAGDALTATQFAAELRRGFDAVNKHCKALAAGGVVATRTGTDRRSTVYFLPEPVRREPGFLDYGWCRLRIR